MFKTTQKRIDIFCSMMTFIPQDAIKWLIEQGYFEAPASTKYHGNYAGGLFDHSLAVTESLVTLTDANGLTWQRRNSPWIIGMFHDLCKMDAYISKDYGQTYEYNTETLLKGHGEKSIMVAANILQLTMEEIACIRYHMGAFTDKEEWRNYTRAVNQYPNVLWTHHADMIASHIKGV